MLDSVLDPETGTIPEASLPRPDNERIHVTMDAPTDKDLIDAATASSVARPSREEAEEAVRTLLRWAGDDPKREGLIDTPKRVVKAYTEWFAGYTKDAAAELGKVFDADLTEAEQAKVLGENLRRIAAPIMREKGFEVTV